MEEVTVKCGCGRTMALDGRRGRGAFRCGCGTTIQITEQARNGTRCVGTAPDRTQCRHPAVHMDPLPLCEHCYETTGLKQYHRWRISGPDVMATDIGSFFDAVAFGRTDGSTPKELLKYRAELMAKVAAGRDAREENRKRQRDDGDEIALGGQVYFMRLDERIKIGKSLNVSKRLQGFSNPMIILLATEPGYTAREQQLHRRFASLRIAGEWFRCEAPLTDYIRGLPGYRRGLNH